MATLLLHGLVRRIVTRVHRWTGLVIMACMLVATVTGVWLTFRVELDRLVNPDLRVTASYTYLDAEVTEAFSASESFNDKFPGVAIGAFSPLVGARPFRRPPNSGTFGVIYTPKRYEVALSMYFSGKRDDSTFLSDEFFGNSMLLPNRDLDKAYQKVDLSGAVNVIPRLKIYTSIENLLDQDYEAAFGFPALPITARVGFKLTLGGDR